MLNDRNALRKNESNCCCYSGVWIELEPKIDRANNSAIEYYVDLLFRFCVCQNEWKRAQNSTRRRDTVAKNRTLCVFLLFFRSFDSNVLMRLSSMFVLSWMYVFSFSSMHISCTSAWRVAILVPAVGFFASSSSSFSTSSSFHSRICFSCRGTAVYYIEVEEEHWMYDADVRSKIP